MKYSAKTIFYVQRLNKRVREGRNVALYRTAGLIRTSSKRSMRLRVGASRPMTPPHAHTRGGLRQIEFVVDQAAGAAIVGPIKFSGSRFFDQPVPHIQEFGGVFINRRGYWKYPERSYMYYTLKRLQTAGKINRQFSVSMATIV
jgi:hypothetical protein